MSHSFYVMDQGEHSESQRMFDYHQAEEMRRWFQAGGISDGMKVLSVGPCNLRELCVLYDLTHQLVIGAEIEPDRVRLGTIAAQEWWNFQGDGGVCPINFVQADVQNGLPFPEGAFDAAVSMRVFEYLAHPEKALSYLYKCLRPGGMCLVGDIDGYASFHDGMDEDLAQQLARILSVLQQNKQFDPNIGRQLYGLFHRAGFVDLSVRVEPYHLITGKIDAYEEQNWLLKLESLRQIGEHVLESSFAYEVFMQRMLAFLRNEQTLLYSMFFLVKGVCP